MTIVAGHGARNRTRTTLRGIAITVVIVALAFPVIWMVLASLKNALSIGDPSQTFVFTPTLDNYVTLIEQNDFLLYILNSAIVAIAATALALLVGLPAAYAIARHSMGRTNMLILAARIIPWISLLVPWYFLFAQVGFVGTYWALIIAHLFVTLPLVVWIMTGFFETLPSELEEAAQVDGLSPAGAFWRIAVPLARPGIATAALLGFIFSWNNFLFSLVLGGNDTRTLPVALFNFIAYASVDWGGLMAASVVTMIPVAVLAVLAQRHIVAGLTAGATKG
ncbi:carbohydrate ABC transporter permease [Microbacterium aurantiacum]|uniref:carbohydrate ABC transporter permease n=1 Tax=Microbacterium aurantiacum TaxID=162393 RepID=UPI003D731ED5